MAFNMATCGDGIMLSLLLAVALFLPTILTVDRNNFKTCDQSSFCKRHRAMQPGDSLYELQMNSLKINPTNIEALLLNKKNGITFKMQFFALIDNTVRMRINELEPMYPRFEPTAALVGEPEQQALTVQSQDENSITLTFGNNKIVVTAKPFKVDIYSDGKLQTSINPHGLLKFEHYRQKPEQKLPDVGEELVPDPNDENEPDMWEETFKSHTDSKPRGPSSVGLDFSFVGYEAIYGIPEHADHFALRSTKGIDPYRLYNLDVFEYELDNTMALYAAIPYTIAHSKTNTIGMFWLNAAETWIDVDYISEQQNVMLSLVDFVKGQTRIAEIDTHWMSESGIIDVFIMLGPSPGDVFKQYARLTGTTELPPYFSLGLHYCRWNFNDEDDVRNVVAGFDEHDIPMDTMWLDIEHSDGKRYLTWDKQKFPHPSEMIANLTATGRKMVIIVDPHIKRAHGYFIHEEASSKGYYIKNKDGNDYEGWCWPGSSSWLDFFNPEVREYWISKFSFDQHEGSSPSLFIWNDMNEPSVFNGPEVTMHKDCKHFGDWEHRDVHNINSMMFQLSTFEGLVRRSGGKQRPFLLSRAGFAGSQRYGAIWTGDNNADWGHLQFVAPMLLSFSITGIVFSGSDIGGFFRNPSPELYVRWFQAGAFHPFMRAHSHIDTNRREPWLYDEESKLLLRDAIRRRYGLLPYWYTLFYEHEKTAMPVMRPMWVEFPTDQNTFRMEDQFMIGSTLLVRPVIQSGDTRVEVYFPEGVWYDAETYEKYDTPGFTSVPVTLSKVPFYQRGGTILPRKNRIRRASTLGQDDPYSLIVALDKSGTTASGTLYIDDGFSYDYKDGAFVFLSITYENGVLKSRNFNLKKTFRTKSWLERLVILGLKKRPSEIQLESKTIGKKKLEFVYLEDKQILVVRKPVVNMAEEWVMNIN